MEKKIENYIGIDVSKLWFDVSVLTVIDHVKQPMTTERYDNTPEGIKEMHKAFKKQKVSFNSDSLLVLENTGVYHRLIWEYCSTHGLPIHIGNAAHIKWSFGIARGKNDVIDSKRLCSYALKNADELKATPVLNPVFMKLKDFMTSRSRLLEQINSIKVYLNELKAFNDKEAQKLMEKAHKAALSGMTDSLEYIEAQIIAIVNGDEKILNNYNLLRSVPGIGHLTAVYLICCTNNFIDKISGKQLACYAGVAPFANKSGTTLKGKDKVHKMANKDLKKLLNMCAVAAITHYPEFQHYYNRKLEEGKHKMSVINAVRNKIVLRAVSVINNKTKYVNNFKKAA